MIQESRDIKLELKKEEDNAFYVFYVKYVIQYQIFYVFILLVIKANSAL